jgi:hypothetical protein
MHDGAVNLRAILWAVLLVAGSVNGWQIWERRPVHPGDGPVAPADPVQSELPAAEPVRYGRWLLTPRARYDITARILSREDYHFDRLADLIPEDLALGWGPMSDNRVLASFDISQSVRFYTLEPHGAPPISREAVIEHSANTHVIPADSAVRSELARLRVGQVVHLTGVLVDGRRADGASFHTSLVRTDTGPGACEVMLVENVAVQ